jgi:hypothetical protein
LTAAPGRGGDGRRGDGGGEVNGEVLVQLSSHWYFRARLFQCGEGVSAP